MQVWSLASGSSGNAYLVRAGETCVLVDCGLPLRVLAERLAQAQVRPEALAGVLVTHEHTDHLGGVPTLVRRHGVPLYATAGTLRAAARRLPAGLAAHPVVADRPFSIGDLTIQPFAVPHDAAEPVGYQLASARGRVCILTDLGHIPPAVAARASETELLILEFNHDETALARGPYPATLKRRIASDVGHLSNRAAAACLVGALGAGHEAVWLAHLSETNNSHRQAAEAAGAAARASARPGISIQIAARGRASLHWNLDGPRQPRLF